MALNEADRAALLEMLRPWMRVLRERTFLASALDGARLASTDIAWLRLPATWAVDLRVFEAFELLALAGAIDDELWKQALSRATTGPRGLSSVCRIGCVLSFSGIDEFPNAVVAWSARMASGADPNTASDEYVRARDWLERLYDEKLQEPSATDTESIKIPVSVWLHEGTFEETMAQLAEVVSIRRPRHDSTTHMASERYWKPLFRVVEVNPGIPDVVTANAIRSMAEIASQGVLVDKFKANGMNVTRETAICFARGLQLLFASQSDNAASSCAAVKIVELPVFMPRRTVTALFSALRTSRSVRFLSVNCDLSPWQSDPDDAPSMNRDEREYLWRWMAFSIFGPHAAHCINHVMINVDNLSAQDVRAFRSQVECPQILPPVQGSKHSCHELSGSAVASTFSSPVDLGTVSDTIQFSPQEVLTVDQDDDESLQVLIPGYGVARVKLEDVHARSHEIPVKDCAVKHLSLNNLNEQSLNPCLELLQKIGGGMRNLSILRIDSPHLLDEWLHLAIEAFSRLETLSVAGTLALRSMEVFTAMLRRGVWDIYNLQLANLRLLDVHSADHFFQTLTDFPNLRLRHLELTLSGLDIADVGINMLDSVASFLRKNHTLSVLVLRLSYLPHTSLRLDIWNAGKKVAAHNQECVCVRRAPLGISQKLAFLSVLATAARAKPDQSSPKELPIAAQSLDRPLISIVFSFAAECERRRVEIRFSKDEV